MKYIDDTQFDARVLASDKPVLVDFTATWCGPCKVLKPILEQYAVTHPEVEVVAVETGDSPATSARYGINAMPTMMLFHGGEVKGTLLGLQRPAKIESFVSEALAS
jgi:thioredoxin